MKIEPYMFPVLIVGVYNLYLFLKRRNSKEPVYRRSSPLNLMLAVLGIFLFIFFIFNS
jgi:hypothetical protein